MKNFAISILLIFSFVININAQQISGQPKFRLGLSYDKTNNQFGASFQPIKDKKVLIKYELGFKSFNLGDENMAHSEVTNFYTVQKTYKVSGGCLLCFVIWGEFGSVTYEPGPDKVLEGRLLDTYEGFYPKVAIPLSQTFYWNVKSQKRLQPILGLGWSATYTSGLRVSSTSFAVNTIDDSKHAEVVRMKQVLTTKKYAKAVVGATFDMGLQLRVASNYHLAASILTGFNMNSIQSSIAYSSLEKNYYQVKFSLSKDF